MKRFLAPAIAATLLVAAAGIWGLMHFASFSPDRSRYPVRGIDVSRHQKHIDWRKVAADDVTFAILKATEGGDWVDPMFARNFREAKAAGLSVGAYHFYRFCKPGAEQAGNFLATVPRDPDLLPPVVDIEFTGNCPERPSQEALKAELAAFLDLVEQAYGKQAVIYLIGDAERMYGGAMPDRRRWVRSLQAHPGHDRWIYWQYHDEGRVDGIEGDVDLNVLQGPAAILEGLASS